MAQTIYDDEEFFAAYSQLRRSVDGQGAAPEWPTIETLLPDLADKHVVDLGCGFGWFCRWAADQGAASVTGVDVSERMLERARAETDDPRITYRREDLTAIHLGRGRFDLAYSALALHYLPDIDGLVDEVYRGLLPGGSFVFSVEHPIFTAPSNPAFGDGGAGTLVWLLDGYLCEGHRTTDWLAPGVVKYHRTIGTHVKSLLRAGFRLTELVEWGPSDEQIAERPEWATERDRPPFLIISARRPG